MGSKQIRTGQLIAPLGPGSIYTDQRGIPHVVAGLDFWFHDWDDARARMVPCSNPEEFERFEPRLSALLGVDRFLLPPDFRAVRRGEVAPPNAFLKIPAHRFPTWYRHTRTGDLRKFNLHTATLDRPEDGGRWQAVRFVAVCDHGHLCEFPWKQWIGCQCTGNGSFRLTDRGGADLTSIRVECQSCPPGSPGHRGRDLGGTTARPDPAAGTRSAFDDAGIRCPGDRPWLGELGREANCRQSLVGALLNQTNLYAAKTQSAISLPDLAIEDDAVAVLRAAILKDEKVLAGAKTLWKMNVREAAAAAVGQSLTSRGVQYESEALMTALTSVFGPQQATMPGALRPSEPETELARFRRDEFNVLRTEIDDPEKMPDLRVIAAEVPSDFRDWLARINLVERMREVRAFYGFTRLDWPTQAPLDDMPGVAMRQLFLTPPQDSTDCWLPAVETFGEGLYLELSEPRIEEWLATNDAWLTRRLTDDYVVRLAGVFQALPPLGVATRQWAARFLLVHTLAHILMNELVFECGYGTAALRERLFVSADSAAPMAGLLIYTAAGDSEGTLGGLVRLGQPRHLPALIQRALTRAAWCSADPVCAEGLGGKGPRLSNLAGCHACVMLPETSCETINHGLDRAMVVGPPEARHHGFLSGLLAVYSEPV